MKKHLLILTMILAVSIPVYAGTDGRKVVTSAGTAENVTTGLREYSVLFICAESDNTGIIAVGTSPVAAAGTQEGVLLGASACMTSDNYSTSLSTIKIDASVSGEGVSYYYE